MFFFGLLVIIISFAIEPIASCVQRRFKLTPYARLEWYSTSVFQLQRFAHEELGLGTWENCDGDLPATAPGTMLATLNIADESHPLLQVPITEKTSGDTGPVTDGQEVADAGEVSSSLSDGSNNQDSSTRSTTPAPPTPITAPAEGTTHSESDPDNTLTEASATPVLANYDASTPESPVIGTADVPFLASTISGQGISYIEIADQASVEPRP